MVLLLPSNERAAGLQKREWSPQVLVKVLVPDCLVELQVINGLRKFSTKMKKIME
jgi:hypothetical protein